MNLRISFLSELINRNSADSNKKRGWLIEPTPFLFFGWGTRSRTSIHGVRVALRQEIKDNARSINIEKILRKAEIKTDDG